MWGLRMICGIKLLPLAAVVLLFFTWFGSGNVVVAGELYAMGDDRLPTYMPSINGRTFLHNYAASIAAMDPNDPDCKNGGVPYRGACQCPEGSGFSGLYCELCQRNDVCPPYSGTPSKCDKSLAIRGTNKQFECKIGSGLAKDLGGGRNVSGTVVLNCTANDDVRFIDTKKGTCSLGLYRIEPNNEFVDSFFECDLSECSMNLKSEGKQDAKNDIRSKELFLGLTTIGQVILLTLCLSFVLLRCFLSRIKRKRAVKIVTGLAIALIVCTALFIAGMFVYMRPTVTVYSSVYECNRSNCKCSPDPKNASYQPFCSKSEINVILNLIKNKITYSCDLATGKCVLKLSDFQMLIEVDCTATECVNTDRFPPNHVIDYSGADLQKTLLIITLVFVAVVALILSLHAVVLTFISRRRTSKFIQIFGLHDPKKVSNDVLSADNNDEKSDHSGGGSLRLKQQSSPKPKTGEIIENTAPFHKDEIAMPEINHQNAAIEGKLTRSKCMPDIMSCESGDIERHRRVLMSSFELCLKDLGYSLPPKNSCFGKAAPPRVILHQVSLKVASGGVLAILGSSGAGKTTLLDILSARGKQGCISGSMFFNGVCVSESSETLDMYRNIIGYVSQDDTLLPALTVYKTIEYAARLKLPRVFSKKMIKNIVCRMIDVLKLQQCQHTIIGDGTGLRGISGGERRRVSIAVELLANPRILFLDEPTSGLDVVSARRVIEAVVELAKESPMRAYAPYFFAFKPIVIFSIHQPSQEIFELFDQILLLSSGVSLYCGPASSAAETLETAVRRLFASDSLIPSRFDFPNHAEYIMKLDEIMDDGVRSAIQEEAANHVSSHEGTEFLRESQDEEGNNLTNDDNKDFISGNDILIAASDISIYYANTYQQLSLLTSRAANCMVSSLNLVAGHAAITTFVGIMMMLLYREQGLDLNGALNRAGAITFLLLVLSLVSMSSLEQLYTEHKLFVVERENGFYRTLPYLLSKIFVDIIPLRIIPSLVLSAVIYFAMGLRTDSGIFFFWFIFIVTVFSVCVTFITLCIGIIMSSFGPAALLSSAVTLWNFVFGGFIVQSTTLPLVLRYFQMVSPFFLAFESILVNELEGQACIFSPVDAKGKPLDVEYPIQCEQYLWNLGLSTQRFNIDVGLLVAFTFALAGLTWLLLSKCTSIVR